MPNAVDPSPEPADEIAAALAKLRGRRMPRPPWMANGDPSGDARGGDDDDRFGPWAGRRGTQDRGTHGRGGGMRGHGERGAPHRGMHGGPHGIPGWPEGLAPRIGGPARLRLLEALAAASHPLSVGEIAEKVGVDQPRASRLVQQSVDFGLVRREADPDDARRTRITLTEAGSAIARGFRGERTGAVQAALQSFTDQERADLARLLTKLAAAWPRA